MAALDAPLVLLGRYLSALGDGLVAEAAQGGRDIALYRPHIAHAAALLPLLDLGSNGAAIVKWIRDGITTYGRSFLSGAHGERAEQHFHELAAALEALTPDR
jgi:hypothetical protein